MGEYAIRESDWADIKIGTCEDMYYLRYSQCNQVKAIPCNVDPADPKTASLLRFRFPWPNEDHIPPGGDEFHDNGYHRGLWIPGAVAPAGVEHGKVQFVAQAGYNCCLPCPEGPESYGAEHVMDVEVAR